MSRPMTKPTKWLCAQRRLRSDWASTQPDQNLRCPHEESLATHWEHSEDSDQTGRMPRLIWVFAGRTVILLVLSWGGSNLNTLFFVSTKCLSMQLQPKNICRGSSSWASIYQQTPQQLHPLGTCRDSGGHWDRKSPLLGSLIYEPLYDKTNKMTVRPAKTQINLGIRLVWSESSLCVQWVATS